MWFMFATATFMSVSRQPDVSSAIIRLGLLATAPAVAGTDVGSRFLSYFRYTKV